MTAFGGILLFFAGRGFGNPPRQTISSKTPPRTVKLRTAINGDDDDDDNEDEDEQQAIRSPFLALRRLVKLMIAAVRPTAPRGSRAKKYSRQRLSLEPLKDVAEHSVRAEQGRAHESCRNAQSEQTIRAHGLD